MIPGGLPLTDPDGGQPLVVAANWVEQAMLGSTATIVATIAVAGIGLLMLAGRVPIRRGLGVVVGCFILFGAGAIAQGIMAIAERGDMVSATRGGSAADILPAPPVPPPPKQPQVYDPYAGASVPVR